MKLGGLFYTIGALLLGGIVLFISLTKASLNIWAHENNENKVNKIPVDIKITTESGEQLQCNYKLPPVNTMPDDLFYGAKNLRDEMWESLTTDKLKKSQILLMLADKKMSEFNGLLTENKLEIAIGASKQAIEKLKEGYQITLELENKEEANKIQHKYIEAGTVYQQILNDKIGTKIESNEVIKEISNWNEEREKEI